MQALSYRIVKAEMEQVLPYRTGRDRNGIRSVQSVTGYGKL